MSSTTIPPVETNHDAGNEEEGKEEEQNAMMAEMGFASFGSKGRGPRAKKVKVRPDGEEEVGTGGNMIPLGQGRTRRGIEGGAGDGKGPEGDETVGEVGSISGKVVMGTGIIGGYAGANAGGDRMQGGAQGPGAIDNASLRYGRTMGNEDRIELHEEEEEEDPHYDDDDDEHFEKIEGTKHDIPPHPAPSSSSSSQAHQKPKAHSQPLPQPLPPRPPTASIHTATGRSQPQHSHPTSSGKRDDGIWDWQALRRGVRVNERGDMAFYDGSFVEDPWRALK